MSSVLTLLKKTRRSISGKVVSYFTPDNKQVLMSFDAGQLKIITSPDFAMHVEAQTLTANGFLWMTGRDDDAVPMNVLVSIE